MESKHRLMVYMLGGFEMYYGGAPLQLKKKQVSKPMMLLQLLLYNRECGVARSTVLESLYGQETEIDAANSLNATVSQLRRMLKETHLPEENYIHVRMNRYYFESSVPVWVDTEEVLALRQEADLKEGVQRQEILYQLCDLYHGRFLPELDGESWVEIARANFQRIYRDSLTEVCQALKEHHAYDEILRLTGVAAQLFPFDEWQVWQQESLLAQGRIREAHDLYRQVEKLYMTELDAQPPERMRARFRKPERESWRRTDSVFTVRKWLEREKWSGPYCIPFPSFLYVYNLVSELGNLTDTPYCLLLCTLSNADGRINLAAKAFHGAMEQLESVLEHSLRWEDAFTRYSRNQFLVILMGAQKENIHIVADRISQRFAEQIGERKLRLDCQHLPAEELMQPKEDADHN